MSSGAVRQSVLALEIIARAGCVVLRGEHEFAVFHGYRTSGIRIGVQVMLTAVQFVDDIESGRHFLEVIDRVATLLRRRVGGILLSILLNLVAGVATGTRTGDSRQGLTASATDLVPQDAPDQRADSRANQPVWIFDGLRVRDLFVVAFLPRSLDRTRLRLDAHDPGGMGRLI